MTIIPSTTFSSRRIVLQKRFSILSCASTEAVEVILSIIALAWGVWVANTFFAAFASSRTFEMIAAIAPEEVWGGAIALIGLFQCVGLLTEQKRMRLWATFAAFLFWLFLGLLFIRANYQSTATAIYPIIAGSAGWVYLRLSLVLRTQEGITP